MTHATLPWKLDGCMEADRVRMSQSEVTKRASRCTRATVPVRVRVVRRGGSGMEKGNGGNISTDNVRTLGTGGGRLKIIQLCIDEFVGILECECRTPIQGERNGDVSVKLMKY